MTGDPSKTVLELELALGRTFLNHWKMKGCAEIENPFLES